MTYIYIFDLLDCSLTMGHKGHYISAEIDTNLFRVYPTCWGSAISKKAPPDDDCYELTMNKTNYIKFKYPVPSQEFIYKHKKTILTKILFNYIMKAIITTQYT